MIGKLSCVPPICQQVRGRSAGKAALHFSFGLIGARFVYRVSLNEAILLGKGTALTDAIAGVFMAGVPGSSFLALSATAAARGILPVTGVALLLGADRLMDSMRVAVNLLGNRVATFVVVTWEKQFDREAMKRAFAGEITNAASSILLGQEKEYAEEEQERGAQGYGPAPLYAGGPLRTEQESIAMKCWASVPVKDFAAHTRGAGAAGDGSLASEKDRDGVELAGRG
ncbi:hypothetical protein GCM10009596_15850 [Arthrobacter rhombi]